MIRKTDRKWIERTAELAGMGMEMGDGGPFGCVIVKENRVIAEGWNRVLAENDPTAHAEMVAIRRACEVLGDFQLNGCELFTSCEPCPMCLGAIYWARPDRVIYSATREDAKKAGFDDEFIYREIPLPARERKIPFDSLPSEECRLVFDRWLKRENKTMY
ncbi:MAG: nucleoside deaminase [Balneolaceae bacterium]|nr:MAG: nucleoside deaminase [Balneolaceae bacterium]